MFFDPGFTDLFREALPWAGSFFRAITELGSEAFYIAFILIVYWVYDKRTAIRTAFVLLASLLLNYWLKVLIQNPRPDPSNWYGDYEASNYSTPSGHAQNSASFFGWIAAEARTSWIHILSLVLIVLIGVSRVYLGVHYLTDVVLGWAVGLFVVVLVLLSENWIRKQISKVSEWRFYAGLFVFGLAATIVSTYLLPSAPSDNFGALGGLVMGVAIALPLEKEYIGFECSIPENAKWKSVVRVLIGLTLVMVSLIGLGVILPSEIVWLRALRYCIVVIIGVFVWPYIFDKLSL
ncbi:MAG: phosphatase PAP2 family protein [Candidatus Lokiarchaeota archaeon]|nr:phosphatase PAP2 family protein [Candidatus Lokiarchaeota archaeon]